MDDTLYCNHKSCRFALTSEAWITSCSHVFCNEHILSGPESVRKCPRCSSDLRERSDVFKRNLNPPDELKATVLAGFSPSKITDLGFKALKFLNFQSFHEKMFLHSYIKRQTLKLAEEEVKRNNEEISSQATIEKLKILIHQQKQECERLQTDLETCKRKNQFLEEKVQNKNRLLHNILTKHEQSKQSHRGDLYVPKNKQRRGPSSHEHRMGNDGTDKMFCSQQLPASYEMNVPYGSAANQRLNTGNYHSRISLSQNY